MTQPLEFDENLVSKLHEVIYGLKQASCSSMHVFFYIYISFVSLLLSRFFI